MDEKQFPSSWSELAARGCGRQVAPEVAPIASALAELTQLSAGERQAMGAKGRAWSKEDYAWPALGVQMQEFYSSLIDSQLRTTQVRDLIE